MLPFLLPLGLLVLLAIAPKDWLPGSLSSLETASYLAISLAFGIGLTRSGVARAGRIWLSKRSSRQWQLGLFFLAFISQAAVALWVFNRLPGTADAESMWFQARLFSEGSVTGISPPAKLFHMFAILSKDYGVDLWCSMYPPGWAALWVPAAWLNLPWLVNPVLGGFLAIVIYRIGRDFFQESVGRLASGISLFSPLVLLLGGTWYSHHASAVCLGLCYLGTGKILRIPNDHKADTDGHADYLLSPQGWVSSIGLGLLTGASMGMAFLVRPTSALLIGICIALGVIVCWRAALRAWKGVLIAGVVAAAFVTLLLGYYHLTTGDAFTSGHSLVVTADTRVGFDEFHTVAEGWRRSLERVMVINRQGLGWPIPMLFLVLLGFIPQRRWLAAWLLLPMWALLALHAAVSYYEVYFPGRYLFSALPGVFILVARGVLWSAGSDAKTSRHDWATGLLLACLCFGVLVSIPATLSSYHAGFKNAVPPLATFESEFGLRDQSQPEQKSLVLMQDSWDGKWLAGNGVFQEGFRRNATDLHSGQVIYVRNRYPKNAATYALFPDRDVYLLVWHASSKEAEFFQVYPERNEEMIRLTPAVAASISPRIHEWNRRDPLELEVPESAVGLELQALTLATNAPNWILRANSQEVAAGQGETVSTVISNLPSSKLTLDVEPGGMIGVELKWLKP